MEPTRHECSNITGEERPRTIKECAYYLGGKPRIVTMRTMIWIILGTFVLVGFYLAQAWWSSKSIQDMVLEHHSDFCKEMLKNEDKLMEHDGVLVIDQTMLLAIKEEQKAISTLLEIQQKKLRENFEILTLWASVLMIIFLVFSIYAMYKMDEMQNRGGESLNRIYDSYIKGLDKWHEIEREYKEKSTELRNKTKKAIEEVQKKADEIDNVLKNKNINLDAEYRSKLESFTGEINSIRESMLVSIREEIDGQRKNRIEAFKSEATDIVSDSVKSLEVSRNGILKSLRDIQAIACVLGASVPDTTDNGRPDAQEQVSDETSADAMPQSTAKEDDVSSGDDSSNKTV